MKTCKVYIVRRPFIVSRAHHVAVLVHDGHRFRTFEHGIRGVRIPDFFYKKDAHDTVVAEYVGETPMTISDIESFERTLTKHYMLGIRDCRHHARDILLFCGVERQ